jgi:hypothetical protein
VIHEATRNSSNSLQQLLVRTELEDEVSQSDFLPLSSILQLRMSP